VTVVGDGPPEGGSAGASRGRWSRARVFLAFACVAVLLGAEVIAGWHVGDYLRTFKVHKGPSDASAASGARSTPEAARLMNDLVSSREAAHRALSTIVAARDVRFVAVLIEVMRASQVGVLATLEDATVTDALEAITGKRFGGDWPAWTEWYGATALVPPLSLIHI